MASLIPTADEANADHRMTSLVGTDRTEQGRFPWCSSKSISRTLCRTLVPAVILSVCIRPVLASGIALREGSVDWMANAFAGEAAKAYDASTATGCDLIDPLAKARVASDPTYSEGG
jgi:hypothetical protein